MKCFAIGLGLLFLLNTLSFAQDTGRLTVSVQSLAQPAMPEAPIAGGRIVVMHWTHSQLHPTMVQDTIATTNDMGTCTIDLPAGTYDVFVSSSGFNPAAFRRDVEAGVNNPLTMKLTVAPLHVHPVN